MTTCLEFPVDGSLSAAERRAVVEQSLRQQFAAFLDGMVASGEMPAECRNAVLDDVVAALAPERRQ
jgi:hypothetical protein